MLEELREFEASLSGEKLKGRFYLCMLTCNPRQLKAWMTDKTGYEAAMKERDLWFCITKRSTVQLAHVFHNDYSPSQRVKFRSMCEAYFGRRFT